MSDVRVFYTAGYKQPGPLPDGAVNIACRPPVAVRERGCRNIGLLYPGRLVWARNRSGVDWREAYRQQLEALVMDGRIKAVIAAVADYDVLMCWEAEPEQCHRLIAAEFIEKHSNGEVRYGGEYRDAIRVKSEPMLF